MVTQRFNRKPRGKGMRFCLSALVLCVIVLSSCGGAPETITAPAPPTTIQGLTSAEVQSVVQGAASSVDTPLVIAVTDRGGNILALFRKPGAPATATGNFGATVDTNELAVALARTASYF